MSYEQTNLFEQMMNEVMPEVQFVEVFSESIKRNTPIEDNLHGDLQETDKKRLGDSYKRVEEFMADNQWHSPQEIAEATQTRIDSALRMVRFMKKYGWLIQKEYKGNGLYNYKAL